MTKQNLIKICFVICELCPLTYNHSKYFDFGERHKNVKQILFLGQLQIGIKTEKQNKKLSKSHILNKGIFVTQILIAMPSVNLIYAASIDFYV